MIPQLIRPDGKVTDVMPMNGADFKLEELYKLVECDCIEIVSLYDGRIMVIDESGHPNGLPRNELATQLYMMGRAGRAETHAAIEKEYKAKGFAVLTIGSEYEDAIVGNALVCDKSMVK